MIKYQKKDRLRQIISEKSLLTGDNFKLASGASSKHYFNMKPTTFDPEGATLIADLILDALEDYPVQAIGGLEMGAIPIASCVSMRSCARSARLPGFFVRKEAKDHGTKARIEPPLPPATRVAIVEDVTTTGNSAMKAAEVLWASRCEVIAVLTLVDRLEGASIKFSEHDLPFIALLTANEFDLPN